MVKKSFNLLDDDPEQEVLLWPEMTNQTSVSLHCEFHINISPYPGVEAGVEGFQAGQLVGVVHAISTSATPPSSLFIL